MTPLLFFKYVPALAGATGEGHAWSTLRHLILPIGLSFYTFMALGYLIDVYTDKAPAERDALRFGAFLSFFPQLTAGPIERAGRFLPQLSRLGTFDPIMAVSGLRAILLGAFMKIAIADTLAPHVNAVYAFPQNHSAFDLALGTVYFSFQVYGDFAGYSLMAIGSARLLGIELMKNFEQPYLSQTLPEYWRRWHISLSSWFRDYVFIPLQFHIRRSGRRGLALALISTFTLVGIWHGAGPKYALFGLIHGVLVAYSTLTIAKRDKLWQRTNLPNWLCHTFRSTITFLVISLTFVLFRASGIANAMIIYGKLLTADSLARTLPITIPSLAILLLIGGDLAVSRGMTWERLYRPLRWLVYYGMIGCVCWLQLKRALGDNNYEPGFIYFGF